MRWILSILFLGLASMVSGQALHLIERADSQGYWLTTDTNGVQRYIDTDSVITLLGVSDTADVLRTLIGAKQDTATIDSLLNTVNQTVEDYDTSNRFGIEVVEGPTNTFNVGLDIDGLTTKSDVPPSEVYFPYWTNDPVISRNEKVQFQDIVDRAQYPDSVIHDTLSSYPLRTELQDTASDLRADIEYYKTLTKGDGSVIFFSVPNKSVKDTLTLDNAAELHIAGTITKLHEGTRGFDPLTKPTNFGFNPSTYGFEIYRSGEGYITNADNIYDFRDLFMPVYENDVCYVSEGGDDSNNGLSEETAKKTMNACFTDSAKYVYVKSGVYDINDGPSWPNAPLVSCNIMGYDGEVLAGAIIDSATTWEQSTVDTMVYFIDATNFSWFVDMRTTESVTGFYDHYESVNSFSELTEGKYYYSGDTLFVQMTGNVQPINEVNCLVVTAQAANDYTRLVQETDTVYVEGINFIGSFSTQVSDRESNSLRLRDCGFYYGRTNANLLQIYGGTFHILSNCKAAFAGDDVYNFHAGFGGSGEIPNIISHNSEGYYNGYDSGNNQISSSHDGLSIIRINDTYAYAQDDLLSDVNEGTTSWNIAVTAYGGFNNGGAAITGFYFTDNGHYYLDACTAGGDGTSIRVSTDSNVYIRNFDSILDFLITGGDIKYY